VLAFQRTLAVGDAGAPALTTTALSSATLDSGAFTPLARRHVAFRLSEPAQVHLRLERRRRTARCGSRRARRRSCASRIGRSVAVRGRKGRNVVALRKLVGSRPVAPGRYRLVLQAVDSSGNRAEPVALALRVRSR
jgi:hypothetical protein